MKTLFNKNRIILLTIAVVAVVGISLAVIFGVGDRLFGTGNIQGGNDYLSGEKITLHVLEIEPCPSKELSQEIIRKWVGNENAEVTITTMTTYEFNGKKENLKEIYDIIYIGSSVWGMNKNNGKTIYNDNTLNGFIYSSTGDIYNVSGLELSGSRLSGNDISRVKMNQLLDYSKAGFPVVIDENLIENITSTESVRTYTAYLTDNGSTNKGTLSLKATVRNKLNVDVTDSGEFTYQWQAAEDVARVNYWDIQGATGQLYLETNATNPGNYRCKVTYTGEGGPKVFYTGVATWNVTNTYSASANNIVNFVNAVTKDTINGGDIRINPLTNELSFYLTGRSNAGPNADFTLKMFRASGTTSYDPNPILTVPSWRVGNNNNTEVATGYKITGAGDYYVIITAVTKDHNTTVSGYVNIFATASSSSLSSITNNGIGDSIDAVLDLPIVTIEARIVDSKKSGGNMFDLLTNIFGTDNVYDTLKDFKVSLRLLNPKNPPGNNEYAGFVSVLQIAPNGKADFLNLEEKPGIFGGLFEEISGGYGINIEVKTITADKIMEANLSYYDVMVVGFTDASDLYAGISAEGIEAIDGFVNSGKGVIFTNETLSYYSGTAELPYSNYFIKKHGNGTNLPFYNTTDNNRETSTVTELNNSRISEYPFAIEKSYNVGKSQSAQYRLDMEDEEITVWYCLNSDYYLNNDAANGYYVYSRGNVYYSGIGLKLTNASDDENEAKLFINLIMAAYKFMGDAPSVVYTDNRGNGDLRYHFLPANTSDGEILETESNLKVYFKIGDSSAGNQAGLTLQVWYGENRIWDNVIGNTTDAPGVYYFMLTEQMVKDIDEKGEIMVKVKAVKTISPGVEVSGDKEIVVKRIGLFDMR